jgi:hypothetical protein
MIRVWCRPQHQADERQRLGEASADQQARGVGVDAADPAQVVGQRPAQLGVSGWVAVSEDVIGSARHDLPVRLGPCVPGETRAIGPARPQIPPGNGPWYRGRQRRAVLRQPAHPDRRPLPDVQVAGQGAGRGQRRAQDKAPVAHGLAQGVLNAVAQAPGPVQGDEQVNATGPIRIHETGAYKQTASA